MQVVVVMGSSQTLYVYNKLYLADSYQNEALAFDSS